MEELDVAFLEGVFEELREPLDPELAKLMLIPSRLLFPQSRGEAQRASNGLASGRCVRRIMFASTKVSVETGSCRPADLMQEFNSTQRNSSRRTWRRRERQPKKRDLTAAERRGETNLPVRRQRVCGNRQSIKSSQHLSDGTAGVFSPLREGRDTSASGAVTGISKRDLRHGSFIET